MYSVSFKDYLPTPRYDGVPWAIINIDEAPTIDGPWEQIDTQALDPIDTDPANPDVRSFTTDLATLPDGWYRLTFISQDGSAALPTAPLHNVEDPARPEFWADLSQVGALLRTRTVDSKGVEQGTFTSDTRPTASQVEEKIELGAEDVARDVGSDIPDSLIQSAQALVALRAAMYVELSYFPEQVVANRSPYDRYKELYDEGLPKLVALVQAAEEEAGEEDTTLVGGMPQFSFDAAGGLIGWGSEW
jgi:hypothetical protein